jgi:hypothetical protein
MSDDDKIIAHADTTEQDSDLPDYCPDRCPTCGTEAEMGYGMAGGGLGAYSYCPKCEVILGKVQDPEA